MRNYKQEYNKRKQKYTEIRCYMENELAMKVKEKLKEKHKTISGWINESAIEFIKD